MSKRTTKSYSIEFKQSSAKLAADSEQSVSQTAKDLGVHETTLYDWVKQYHPKKALTSKTVVDVNEELKRLKKENSLLKLERDILKKATAYFAKDIL